MKSIIVALVLLLFSAVVSAIPINTTSTGLPVDTSVILMQALNQETTKREIYSTTSDELAECKPVTMIFARGTFEPGNIGLLAGPPFFNALSYAIGDKLAVQGVPYPANIAGYLAGGDAAGSKTFAQLTQQAASRCPQTQIVLSGYSQGSQLLHNAKLPPAVAARVKAVVLFGDPFEGRPIPNIPASRVKTFCFSTDLICYNTVFAGLSHLSYSIDAWPATEFVRARISV